MKKIFGVPKNIFYLGLVSLLNDASSDMAYPLIPLFLTKVLGASFGMVGIIEGIAESTASLLKVFSGYWSDKIQKRKGLTVLGYSISAISKPILAYATAPWHVLAVRFSDRFGKGVRTAPRDALIATSVDPSIMGRAFGFHRAMDTLGAVIGPILAFLLLPLVNQNYRTIFLLSFVAAALGVITLTIFVREVKKDNVHDQVPKIGFRMFDRRFKVFLLGVTVFSLGNSSDAFLLLRANNVGLAAALVPLVYLVFNITAAALSTPLGIWSDKFGHRKVIILGFLVFAIAYLGFARVSTTVYLWPLFVLYGVYAALSEGIIRAHTAELVPENIKGTAYGTLHTLTGLALLPAGVIAGYLWQVFGPQFTFYYGTLMAALAVLILMAVPTRK